MFAGRGGSEVEHAMPSELESVKACQGVGANPVETRPGELGLVRRSICGAVGHEGG
jgi:hypothetical protein